MTVQKILSPGHPAATETRAGAARGAVLKRADAARPKLEGQNRAAGRGDQQLLPGNTEKSSGAVRRSRGEARQEGKPQPKNQRDPQPGVPAVCSDQRKEVQRGSLHQEEDFAQNRRGKSQKRKSDKSFSEKPASEFAQETGAGETGL